MVAGFTGGLGGKESACNIGDMGSIPGSGRSSGGGRGTPVFLPGESYGQRSWASYSPEGCKESDMTERLSPHASDSSSAVRSVLSFFSSSR